MDHFNDIDDVAALCSALDFVVSSRTAVAFIAAGVGRSTKFAHWRQSSWNNILFNPIGPSIEMFDRNTWDPWDVIFSRIAEGIS